MNRTIIISCIIKSFIKMRKCIITFATAILKFVITFNLDTENSISVFTDSDNTSHFGYTVSLRNTTNRKLIVGAPFAKENGERVGAIYSCTLNTTCRALPGIKPQPDRYRQLMGMSLTSVGDDVFAGASGYDGYTISYNESLQITFKQNMKKAETGRFHPDNSQISQRRYLVGGISSSSLLNKDTQVFISGMPGSRLNRGALYTVYKSNNAVSTFKSSNIEYDKTTTYGTGYSVAIGKFGKGEFNEDKIADVATGAHNNETLQGKILFYTVLIKSQEYKKICDEIKSHNNQTGSYFGFSIYAVDLNNDGRDDLLVGAPFYSINQDEGQVYIYMGKEGNSCFDGNVITLEGENRVGERFGSSIANIGDINLDGYDDVAIGAPYGGIDQNGAVFIYNGGQSGIRKDTRQIIYSKDMPDGGGRGFGISIAGSVDVDGNRYPDVAVGAYHDSKAYLIKSLPVIYVKSKMHTSVNEISTLDDKLRCINNQSSYQCIDLFFDITYYGLSNPDVITMEININLDMTKQIKRAFTSMRESEHAVNVTLEKGVQKRINLSVEILVEIKTDFITPIVFTSNYKTFINQSTCSNGLCAIIDQYHDTATHEITYITECPINTTSYPNLNVTNKIDLPKNKDVDAVIFGQVNTIFLLSTIENYGDLTCQTKIIFTFSSDLEVTGVTLNQEQLTSFWKHTKLNSTTKKLDFLINPIASNASVDIVAKFSINTTFPSSTKYVFITEVLVLGNGTGTYDIDTQEIEIKIETCVRITAEAKPPQYHYKLNVKEQVGNSRNVDVIGSEVNFTFYIQNSGYTPIENLQIDIKVPVKKKNFDFIYVVYLGINGQQCNENVNHLNYTTPFKQENIYGRRNAKRRKFKEICTNGDCKIYSCIINRIDAHKGSKVLMVTRLWNQNLPKIKYEGEIEAETIVSFIGSNNGSYVMMKKDCNTNSSAILTLRKGVEKGESEKIHWWMLILAISGAILILIIFVMVLYKCGFFNRKQPFEELDNNRDGQIEKQAETCYDDIDGDDEDEHTEEPC